MVKVQLNQIKNVLRHHGVICMPTETLMGLGVKFNDQKAYEKLNKIKCREPDKPYSLMCRNVFQAKKYIVCNEDIDKIFNAFLPGPLTILVKANTKKLPNWCYKDGVIGIRIPMHPVLNEVLNYIDFPLLAPSANRSGENPSLLYSEAFNVFHDEVDCYIDSDASGDKASTILDMTSKPYKIIREGTISKKQLADVVEVM